MINYSVRITTKAWVTTVVNVKATDEEAARSGALLVANDPAGPTYWDFCEFVDKGGATMEDAPIQGVRETKV
jgi:hypothetical protein